ncbi:MAG TPA: hypothetical protein VN969_47050 [Streptosporangiaceae bacterium]|jgi:hypothetical protein|nr:hypothetical protein [Streptosporangiaceae bacterium]
MSNCLPLDVTADADDRKMAPAAGTRIVRHLIAVMLLTAAALDLTRCGLVMAAARHPASATAALGILLAVTILATAGPVDRRIRDRQSSSHDQGSHAVPRDAARPAPARRSEGHHP